MSAFGDELARRFRAFPVAGTPNEAVTEHDLILPVLAALGWEHVLPQQVLYAEDRRLLPADDARYDDYSLRRLREEVERRTDAGDALSARATAYDQRLRDLFAAIGEGDDSIGLPPYDGGLFEPGREPLLERTRLPDADLAPIVDALSRREGPLGRRRWINFRDLSVQHLGSIYERLLEFEPTVEADGRLALRLLPYARKGSGSYWYRDERTRARRTVDSRRIVLRQSIGLTPETLA